MLTLDSSHQPSRNPPRVPLSYIILWAASMAHLIQTLAVFFHLLVALGWLWQGVQVPDAASKPVNTKKKPILYQKKPRFVPKIFTIMNNGPLSKPPLYDPTKAEPDSMLR